jgi:hypothetical protein
MVLSRNGPKVITHKAPSPNKKRSENMSNSPKRLLSENNNYLIQFQFLSRKDPILPRLQDSIPIAHILLAEAGQRTYYVAVLAGSREDKIILCCLAFRYIYRMNRQLLLRGDIYKFA